MGRNSSSGHLLTAKGGAPRFVPLANETSRHQPRTLTDHLDRLSPAWIWRLTLVISVMVWGIVIWALFAVFP
jgi:hypothetical protein